MDRFKAMQVFNQVVTLGSFTAAAAALHLPKARVTTVVQELESHLGVRLLNRTTRRISLTDDGAMYHPRAVAMLQELGELEGSLRRAVITPVGRLRVDVPSAVGRHVVAPALPDFFARYPGMVLALGSSDRPVDLVAEGVDCVIRGGLMHDETLVARPLGSMSVITCAAPSYLARYGTPLTLADLSDQVPSAHAMSGDKGHRFVNFYSPKTGRVFPFDFAQGGQTHQISRPHWVSCNDAGSYLAAGLAGLGLMQSPRTRYVAQLLTRGELVQVLPDWSAGQLPLAVLYPRNHHLTAKVRAFADWVCELYEAEFAAMKNLSASDVSASATNNIAA